MICGRCEFMSPTDGACRLPSFGRQLVAYFQEACKARNTQNDNDMKETRKCRICGKELPLEEFAKDSRSGDGISHICNDCAEDRKSIRAAKFKRTMFDKKHGLKNAFAAVAEEIVKEDYMTKEETEKETVPPQPFGVAELTAVRGYFQGLKNEGWHGELKKELQNNIELTITIL